MNKASGWAFLDALLARNQGRGIPHMISANVTFAALDEEQPVLFRFADQGMRFIWGFGLYASNNANVMAGTDTTYGGATLQLSNVGGSGSFDNGDPMPIGAIFGRDGVGGGEKALPLPYTFQGNSTLKMSVKNKVAGAQTIFFSLIGLKVEA
jgi:hypothetical protein